MARQSDSAIMAPQVIAVIGNIPTVWGDGMLALCMSCGLLEDIKNSTKAKMPN